MESHDTVKWTIKMYIRLSNKYNVVYVMFLVMSLMQFCYCI